VRQEASASGSAQQAVLGSGTQNVYLGERERQREAAVSIAAPVGQRDDSLPLRGRNELLAELAGADPRVRVLHGLGGCGKTRLALEVAYQAQQDGAEVWWVSAAEPGVLAAGMQALGRRLGVTDAELEHGDAADVIWLRLTARQDPWLLVLDNADDPQLLAGAGTDVAEGCGWLRPVTGQTGRVLVTSRDGSPASWGSWPRRHRLETLTTDPAVAVLADHADHHPGLGSEEDARRLAARLGGLPLALKIAGSYLAEATAIPAAFTGPGVIRTYQEYQDAIQTGDLGAVFPMPTGELSPAKARRLIGRTWDLTLGLLDARPLPEARPVLRLLASFADTPVPYQLLLHPDTLAASAPLRDITGSRLWETLKALNDFGLIDLDDSNQGAAAVPVARLHPLIRDTSSPATGPDHRVFLELAAQLLGRAARAEETGVPEDPLRWPFWQVLAPHSAAVFRSIASKPGFPGAAVEAAAYAAYMAARYRAEQGNHAAAETEFRDVLAARLRVLGLDHPDTLATRHQIALEIGMRGHPAAAEAEFRDVLAARLRVLGPDHPDTLTTRYCIAEKMSGQRNHAAAEAEFRDVLAARLRVLGPNHPDTLTTWQDIALQKTIQGNQAAEAEYRDVLAAELRVLGSDHPTTLITRHGLALEIGRQGNHTAAEADFRDVLASELRVLGPDHPTTLLTRYCIALEIGRQGNHAAAEAEHRDVLAARLRVLGPDDPETLTTRYSIAQEIAEQGNHAAAEAELRDVLAARLRVFGPDHPGTLVVRHDIAVEMAGQGNHAAAVAEFRDVLTARLRVLGPDHPDTQETSSWISYLARQTNA
jgi:plasmid stability protein